MFNWLNLVAAIPMVIQGVQLIHADAPGTTKKQVALQWLGLGIGTAGAVGGINAQQTQELGTAAVDVSNIIDSMVSLFHKTNAAPGFGVVPLAATTTPVTAKP